MCIIYKYRIINIITTFNANNTNKQIKIMCLYSDSFRFYLLYFPAVGLIGLIYP